MEIKVSKSKKILCSSFFAILTFFMCSSFVGFAVDQSSLNSTVGKYLVKRTGIKSFTQSIEYEVLKVLSKLIDEVQNVIDTLLKINLYDLVKDVFNVDSIYPLAWAIFSLALICGACLLLINSDKTRLSDYFRGIIISSVMIIALPTLFSSLNDLKNAGIKDVKATGAEEGYTISEDGEWSTKTLGSNLLAKSIFNIVESVDKNKLTTFYEGNLYNSNANSVYNLDINQRSNCVDYYYVSSGTQQTKLIQTKYSELSTDDKISLLGENVYGNYALWKDLDQKTTFTTDEGFIGPYAIVSNGDNYTASEYQDLLLSSFSSNSYNAIISHYDCSPKLAEMSSSSLFSYANDVVQKIKNSTTIAQSIQIMEDTQVFFVLNSYNNGVSYKEQDNLDENSYAQLIQKSYNDDTWAWLGKLISNTGEDYIFEYIYAYRIDFFVNLLIMLVTVLSLFFATLKIASLMFDLLFTQIVGPLIIASDTNNSGRAKQVIQNILSTYIIFIVVVLLVRIYLVVLTALRSSETFGTMSALIILMTLAGAKFVIDGPDLVTKILGIDAGVKSGVSTIMGIRSATQMAHSAAHSVSNLGHSVANAPTKAGGAIGKISQTIKDANSANGASGKINAVMGDTKAGQAFKSAQNSISSTNSASSISNGTGGSVKEPSKADGSNGIGKNDTTSSAGKDGMNGHKGSAGDKGVNGKNGTDGIKGSIGANGTNGSNGTNGEDGQAFKGSDSDGIGVTVGTSEKVNSIEPNIPSSNNGQAFMNSNSSLPTVNGKDGSAGKDGIGMQGERGISGLNPNNADNKTPTYADNLRYSEPNNPKD